MSITMQDGETLLYEQRPDKRVVFVWLFTKCLRFGVIGAFLLFVLQGFVGGELWPEEEVKSPFNICAVTVTAMGGLVLTCIAIVYVLYLRRTYVYYITSQRCVRTGGILYRVEHSVPYHKITNIEITQNIVERVVGLVSVSILTPTALGPERIVKAEIRFEGLADGRTPAALINGMVKGAG